MSGRSVFVVVVVCWLSTLVVFDIMVVVAVVVVKRRSWAETHAVVVATKKRTKMIVERVDAQNQRLTTCWKWKQNSARSRARCRARVKESHNNTIIMIFQICFSLIYFCQSLLLCCWWKLEWCWEGDTCDERDTWMYIHHVFISKKNKNVSVGEWHNSGRFCYVATYTKLHTCSIYTWYINNFIHIYHKTWSHCTEDSVLERRCSQLPLYIHVCKVPSAPKHQFVRCSNMSFYM